MCSTGTGYPSRGQKGLSGAGTTSLTRAQVWQAIQDRPFRTDLAIG
jgi:hypothetical protein